MVITSNVIEEAWNIISGQKNVDFIAVSFCCCPEYLANFGVMKFAAGQNLMLKKFQAKNLKFEAIRQKQSKQLQKSD